MNNDDKYRITTEERSVFVIRDDRGEILSEHDTEIEARNCVNRLSYLYSQREKALATPGSTRFQIGDRIRFCRGRYKYGSEDVPATVEDIFCDTSPSDRGDCFYYRLRWDNGVKNEYPTMAVEDEMETLRGGDQPLEEQRGNAGRGNAPLEATKDE